MSSITPKAIAHYNDAVRILQEIERHIREEDRGLLGLRELREKFGLWSKLVHGSYGQIRGTQAEQAAIIDVISLHLAHNQLDIDRLEKADAQFEKHWPDKIEDYNFSVRNWVAITSSLCPTPQGSYSSLLEEHVEEFLTVNADAINRAYPGVKGIAMYSNDTHDSLLASHAGVLLARELDRELLTSRQANTGVKEKPWLHPPRLFDVVDDEIFLIPGVWNKFYDEVKKLASRCGNNGVQDFRDFLWGARRNGLIETFHAMANSSQEFNFLMGALSDTTSDSLVFQRQDSAVDRFMSEVRLEFRERSTPQMTCLSKILTTIQEGSIDPAAFAECLNVMSIFSRDLAVHPLASRWTAKNFVKSWKKSRLAHDREFDASDPSMENFIAILKTEFPDKKDLTTAVGLLEEVYAPTIRYVDRDRFNAFVTAATEELVRLGTPSVGIVR